RIVLQAGRAARPGADRTEGAVVQREPVIEQRAAQPYAGIRMRIRMDGFPAAADTTIPELFGWLAEQGIPPAGPPFIRYYVIDMAAATVIGVRRSLPRAG